MRVGTLVGVVVLVVGMGLAVGCAKPKASSSTEAIQQARTLKTPEEQANYLLSQAQAFLNSKKYQEATKTAQHVASNFQTHAEEAKTIIARAAEQLGDQAEAAVGDAAKKLGL